MFRNAEGGSDCQLPLVAPYRDSVEKPQCAYRGERQGKIKLLSGSAASCRYRAGSSRVVASQRRRLTVDAVGGSRIRCPIGSPRRARRRRDAATTCRESASRIRKRRPWIFNWFGVAETLAVRVRA